MRLVTPSTAVIAVAVAAVLGVAYAAWVQRVAHDEPVVAAGTPGPAYSLPGTIRLQPGEYERRGQTCEPTTMSADAQVIVTDGSGAALTYAPISSPGRVVGGVCEVTFMLTVPAGQGSYGIDIPRWGRTTYSEQEMADLLALTFG